MTNPATQTEDAFQAFTRQALVTESPPAADKVNPTMIFLALSMIYEQGKLMDLIKKAIFQQREVSAEAVAEALVAIAQHLSPMAAMARSLNDPTPSDLIQVHTSNDQANAQDLDASRINLRMAHALIGDASENGEVAKALLDHIVTGKPLDKVNIGEEYADKDWYKALMFDEVGGLSEQAGRDAVIAKLAKRYKGGFSAEASEQRDTQAERSILEQHMGTIRDDSQQ